MSDAGIPAGRRLAHPLKVRATMQQPNSFFSIPGVAAPRRVSCPGRPSPPLSAAPAPSSLPAIFLTLVEGFDPSCNFAACILRLGGPARGSTLPRGTE